MLKLCAFLRLRILSIYNVDSTQHLLIKSLYRHVIAIALLTIYLFSYSRGIDYHNFNLDIGFFMIAFCLYTFILYLVNSIELIYFHIRESWFSRFNATMQYQARLSKTSPWFSELWYIDKNIYAFHARMLLVRVLLCSQSHHLSAHWSTLGALENLNGFWRITPRIYSPNHP